MLCYADAADIMHHAPDDLCNTTQIRYSEACGVHYQRRSNEYTFSLPSVAAESWCNLAEIVWIPTPFNVLAAGSCLPHDISYDASMLAVRYIMATLC